MHGLSLQNITFTTNDIKFVMSEEENKNAGTWRFLNVLFVLCVIGLIIMVIVSTILSQKRMKAKKIEAI